MRPATFDAIDTRSQGDDQKGHLTGALPCMRKRPPSFLAINQILVLRPLTKTPPCINSCSARRFGRKLQTPFIGFGKGQGQLLSSRVRVLFKKPSPRNRVACAADTDSDVHCGSDVHLLRFVPAHCTGEHFAILGRHRVFGR